MKRKKLWIILISVIAGLIAFFTGGYFLTKLSSVSVEFRTRLGSETRLEEGILDRVKESGDFDYSASVLFLDTKENINNIEKKHPYVKVEQVIRKFPNKLCIYISERIPRVPPVCPSYHSYPSVDRGSAPPARLDPGVRRSAPHTPGSCCPVPAGPPYTTQRCTPLPLWSVCCWVCERYGYG